MKWFRGPAGTLVTHPAGLGVSFSAVDSVLSDDLDILPKSPGKKPPRSCSLSIVPRGRPYARLANRRVRLKSAINEDAECSRRLASCMKEKQSGFLMLKSRNQTDHEMEQPDETYKKRGLDRSASDG